MNRPPAAVGLGIGKLSEVYMWSYLFKSTQVVQLIYLDRVPGKDEDLRCYLDAFFNRSGLNVSVCELYQPATSQFKAKHQARLQY
jgi:hypothetical protein